MKKIRRDDEIVVIAGRDKGKHGKVIRVLPDGRLIVSGINMVKKHQKPNPAAGVAGGIIEKEAPIQVSNVAVFNPDIGKGDRVGFAISEEGKKERIFKSTGKLVGA